MKASQWRFMLTNGHLVIRHNICSISACRPEVEQLEASFLV